MITSFIRDDVIRWDYDIIHLERVCQEARRLGPLYYVGSKIFKDFNVSETLGVDETTTSCWLKVCWERVKLGVCRSVGRGLN